MFTQQLWELVEDGYVHRKVYAQVLPKVEYSLTKAGKTNIPINETLRDWELNEMKREVINPEDPKK